MATAPDEPSGPVRHLKIVRRANRLFARLRDAGTERDTAGNRTLLYSHYASLVLLGLFNPALQTLRGLQQASQLKGVQKRLGVGRASLGSLSESSRVFDPDLLVPMAQELLAELPDRHSGPGPRRAVPDVLPRELAERLTAVDGTVLRALPQLARADWKLHLHFRPLSGHPGTSVFAGEHDIDERDVLGLTLEPGRTYLADRGYERYALDNRVVAAGSDYVIRGQGRPAAVAEERPLSAEARAARVVSDAVVTLSPGKRHPAVAAVGHPVRRVVIEKRDRGRPRSDRPDSDRVVLYTSLMSPSAEAVAAMYEMRWSIELFFRFLKQMLGLRRLFSGKAEAAAIQVYCALIAGLLMSQLTGGRVTMAQFRLVQLYLQGWADDEELTEGLKALRGKDTT